MEGRIRFVICAGYTSTMSQQTGEQHAFAIEAILKLMISALLLVEDFVCTTVFEDYVMCQAKICFDRGCGGPGQQVQQQTVRGRDPANVED